MTNAEKRKRYRPTDLAAKSLKQMQKASEERRFMVRARLAKRDLDYASSPCAARVTAEERGGVRIETRGRRCIGCMAAGVVKSV